MLKNYIKIAIRNIRRNKIYSTISVLGLTIGITEATLLYLYVDKDFHFQSMHHDIAPIIIGYWANPIRVIDFFSIKVAGSNLQGTIEQIKGVHEQFDPETVMEYRFLDEQIDQSYRAEVRAGHLFGIGGEVTIFIACMGLFGLALLATETRIREIGIRKVLGASVPDILTLLTTDFVKLVAIAFIIAIPVGWIVMNS